jgi:predicted ATPase/DNA-binding winged helix-turn-helix (wHTH) protein
MVTGPFPSGDFAFGRFVVQPETRQLLLDGGAVRLGARAFDVLLALIHRRDRVVGKSELLDLVWPGLVVEENNLQVQISALRKLLGPQAIATIPGRGYRFSQKLNQGADGETAGEPPIAAPASGIEIEVSPALLGRDDDLKALDALVRAHRLVTVVGAGGIGKTAVARALAHRIGDAFEHGACLVELAPVSDPSLVATTAASALQIKLGSQPPLEAMAEALAGRRMLIVLDNCEHLLLAVAELVESLGAATPGVHWLATSQEPLRIAAEQVFRIGALALPAEESLDAARAAGAVALFEARAQAADPRFSLTAANVAVAIDICRKLDGIALAIELAAARVPLLGIEGLRGRLDERLRVLTSGSRLALPRHQTMRAALEWSHGLLTPSQQTVFRRLGVFSGSFALEAAQQVAADQDIDEWAVLDALGALVDKSLVVVEPDTGFEPRYRLLETMREFALDRLQAAGDGDATRTRHLDAFVALAEQARSESYGPQQGRLMEQLDLEVENVLAAHAWCEHMADGGERDLRLVTGLFRYWLNRALLLLGYRVTQEALSRTGSAGHDRLRREALTHAGRLASRIGQYQQAIQAHDAAVALARGIGAADILSDALTFSGMSCAEQGEFAAARVRIEEAFALSRQLGADSEKFGKAALALGELERLDGQWSRAESLYEAALAQARRQGDIRLIGSNLHNLVMTALAQDSTDRVRERLLEAARLNDELAAAPYQRVFPLLLCAGLAAVQGDWEESALFDGAAMFHFDQLKWPLDPADKVFVDSFSARTRAALGDSAFERSRAVGRGLALEEALARMQRYLCEELPSTIDSEAPRSQTAARSS